MTPTVLILDGNNLAMRSIKAFERPGVAMLSADGIPTGPLVIFINTVTKVIREELPDQMVVCWDGGGSDYRQGLDPDYKAGRGNHGEHEGISFRLIKEFCTLAGMHHAERKGVEADDLVAWYWRAAEAPCWKVIVSNDKDFLQLIDFNTVVVRPSGSNVPSERWDLDKFHAERGYSPSQEPLVMALTGDKADGVPSVPGCGPKTAVKILRASEWDWTGALTHPKVAEHAQRAVVNRALVDLRWAIPFLQLRLPPIPDFHPTDQSSPLYGDFLAFLSRYRLAKVTQKLYAGSLWRNWEDDPEAQAQLADFEARHAVASPMRDTASQS